MTYRIVLFSLYLLPFSHILSFPIASSRFDLTSLLIYLLFAIKFNSTFLVVGSSLFSVSFFSYLYNQDIFNEYPLYRSAWSSLLFAPFILVILNPRFRLYIRTSSLQRILGFWFVINIPIFVVNLFLFFRGFRPSFPFDEPARLSLYCFITIIPMLFAAFDLIKIRFFKSATISKAFIVFSLFITLVLSLLTRSSHAIIFLSFLFLFAFALSSQSLLRRRNLSFPTSAVIFFLLCSTLLLLFLIFFISFNLLVKFNVLASPDSQNLSSLSWLNGFANASFSASSNPLFGFGLGSYGYVLNPSNTYGDLLIAIHGELNKFDGYSFLFKTVYELGLIPALALFLAMLARLYRFLQEYYIANSWYNFTIKLMASFALVCSLVKEPTMTFFPVSLSILFYTLKVV